MPLSSANRSRLHATVGCAVAGLLWWRTRAPAFAVVWALAIGLLALACLNPRRYEPVQRLFTTFGRIVTATITWIILGLVYFLIFTPAHWWNRLVGREPLGSRRSTDTSFFHDFPAKALGRFERQY
jgi:hypothetical protein